MLAGDDYALFQTNVLQPLLRVYAEMGFDPNRSNLSPELLRRLAPISGKENRVSNQVDTKSTT